SKTSPAVAMPFPPSAPPDLRILARATWPQITAGIAVNSQACKRKNSQNEAPNRGTRSARDCLRNGWGCRGWGFVGHGAVGMKLGGEIKARRLLANNWVNDVLLIRALPCAHPLPSRA